MSRKSNKPESDDQLDPVEAQRRMDDAVRRMLSTKPETHEEMVERKHRAGDIKQRKADIERRKQFVQAGRKPKPKRSV